MAFLLPCPSYPLPCASCRNLTPFTDNRFSSFCDLCEDIEPMESHNLKNVVTNEKGQRICGARKKTGELCQATILFVSGRCKTHGGMSPRGIAHPNTKTGRYSKSLPAKIFTRMQEHLDDKRLLELNDDIALITALIEEAQSKLYADAESQGVWKKLLSLKERAMNAKNNEVRGDYVRQMFLVLEQADRFISAQEEIIKLLDQRRRFVDSETSRRLKLAQGVTLDQVGTFFHALASAVKEEVTPDVLQRIQAKFERLSNASHKLSIDTRLDGDEASGD